MLAALILEAALLVLMPPADGGTTAQEILERFLKANRQNSERAVQYAYAERAGHFTFDKNNAPKPSYSETFEHIFVEGEDYKRLVLRDDRALNARQQAKEDKRLAQTREERQRRRRSGLLHKTVSMGTYDELPTLFDCRLAGEEEIRGRKAWVIEAAPKPGHVPANDHEKDAMSFRRKLWIDQIEHQLLQITNTVEGSRHTLLPGSTMTWEFGKVQDDTWMPAAGFIDARFSVARMVKPHARTEYRYSDFRRFDVQSTITVSAEK